MPVGLPQLRMSLLPAPLCAAWRSVILAAVRRASEAPAGRSPYMRLEMFSTDASEQLEFCVCYRVTLARLTRWRDVRDTKPPISLITDLIPCTV